MSQVLGVTHLTPAAFAQVRPASVAVLLVVLAVGAALLTGGAPADAAESTIVVSEDSYVSTSFPTTNKGTSHIVRADRNPTTRGYLKFTVPDTGDAVTRATLRVYAESPHKTGVRVHRSSTAWSEGGIYYNNAPLPYATMIGQSSQFTAESWVSVDVSSYVTGPGTYSLVLVSSDSTAISFTSREGSGSRAAQLIIETDDDPTPPPPSGQVLLAMGDIGACNRTTDEAVAALVGTLPGTIATLGDTVYEAGSPTEFANCFDPAWGALKPRIKPAVGNHEYGTPGASGYWNYFGAAAGTAGKGWYSYDLGNWHLIAMNSVCSQVQGCQPTSEQVQWLETDLAANSKQCIIAYWHHPLFSSGSHSGDERLKTFWDVLYREGAEIVLNGHEHDYERFAPQDPAGNADSNGIRQFVVGTGGKTQRHFDEAIAANSQVRLNTYYGALRLDLGENSYTWQFIDTDGIVRDSGSSGCQGTEHAGYVAAPSEWETLSATDYLLRKSLCVGKTPALDEAVLPTKLTLKHALKSTLERTRVRTAITIKRLLNTSGCGECCCTQTCSSLTNAYTALMDAFPEPSERVMRSE